MKIILFLSIFLISAYCRNYSLIIIDKNMILRNKEPEHITKITSLSDLQDENSIAFKSCKIAERCVIVVIKSFGNDSMTLAKGLKGNVQFKCNKCPSIVPINISNYEGNHISFFGVKFINSAKMILPKYVEGKELIVEFNNCSFENYHYPIIARNFTNILFKNCTFSKLTFKSSIIEPTLNGVSGESISFVNSKFFEISSFQALISNIKNINITNCEYKDSSAKFIFNNLKASNTRIKHFTISSIDVSKSNETSIFEYTKQNISAHKIILSYLTVSNVTGNDLFAKFSSLTDFKLSYSEFKENNIKLFKLQDSLKNYKIELENLVFEDNKRTILHSIDYFTTEIKNLKIVNNILHEGENLFNLHFTDINVPPLFITILKYKKGKIVCFTENISIKGNKAKYIFNIEIQHKSSTIGGRLLAEKVSSQEIKNYIFKNCLTHIDNSDLTHTFHVKIIE